MHVPQNFTPQPTATTSPRAVGQNRKAAAVLMAIKEALGKCAIAYPAARMEDAAILAMAKIWAEDLGHFRPATIAEAVKRHRQASKYWPTIAEITTLCEAVEAEPATRAQDAMALPPGQGKTLEWSEEQTERNRRGALAVISKLRGRMQA